jgi:rhodanese-related sulfurtransferase
MQRHGVHSVAADEVQRWLEDTQRTTYVIDVRTPEEFAAGSIPGAIHAPGGQLVQATDQWVGVRNARIVLVDSEGVRAPVVAGWLKQLGCDAYVLEEGTGAKLRVAPSEKPRLPALPTISAEDLRKALDSAQCSIFDLRASMSYRKAHVPGSRWSIRPKMAAEARGAREPIVLIADEPEAAQLAAVDLRESGCKDVRLLDGGLAAWANAGYETVASPDSPPDAACIDYLFFVHDRHAGNRDAMRQYLAWETGLIAQLGAQDRTLFKVGEQVTP